MEKAMAGAQLQQIFVVGIAHGAKGDMTLATMTLGFFGTNFHDFEGQW
jgi:hypothetical protein